MDIQREQLEQLGFSLPDRVTNYDRIISKTPEELAEWIYQMQDWDAHRKENFLPPLSKSWWFDWLKQEATDGT